MSRITRSIILALIALVAVLAFAGSASAYCGPGFTNKKQAIAYYQTKEGKKFLPSMKKKLVAKGFMHKDQTVMAFLKSPRVVFKKTPKGFVLDYNTSCNGSTYGPYGGLYAHGNKGVLAVIVKTTKSKIGKPKKGKSTTKVVETSPEISIPNADGSIDIFVDETKETTTPYSQKYRECTYYRAFMKDYCRNIVHSVVWHECKTFVEHYTKKMRRTTRRHVRTIPAPTPAPSGGGEMPSGTPPPDTGCHVEVHGDVNNNGQLTICGGDNHANCTIMGAYHNDNNVCVKKCADGSEIPEANDCPQPPPATCDEGQTGSPPNCVTPCKPDEVGTPPHCHVPTCTELGNCPPPPKTCQELGNCPKPGLSITTMNDVQMSYTSDGFCATAQLVAGHSGTLTMSAGFGHWGSHNLGSITFQVTGTQKVCALIADDTAYTAPTEAPSGDSDIPDGYDRITVNLSDGTYQSSIEKSTTFKILTPEPNAP
jgi:hypothetical protein